MRRLPRMQEVVGSNPTERKICFSQFTLFYRVECEKLFCKTNIKLKELKLNKTKHSIKAYLCSACTVCIHMHSHSTSNLILAPRQLCTVYVCVCPNSIPNHMVYTRTPIPYMYTVYTVHVYTIYIYILYILYMYS